YSPVVGGNPFNSAYLSHAGYFHPPTAHTPPHPLSVPPGVFRHPSPAGPGLPQHARCDPRAPAPPAASATGWTCPPRWAPPEPRPSPPPAAPQLHGALYVWEP